MSGARDRDEAARRDAPDDAPEDAPEPPPARHEIEAALRRLAAGELPPDALGEAALLLAALDRPRVGLTHYRQHLEALARSVAEAARTLDPPAALEAAVRDELGYEGDRLTYDDLQNANLMRVIDRRRGLPVTLGILYLVGARAQGWQAEALRFPGHVLIRLDTSGQGGGGQGGGGQGSGGQGSGGQTGGGGEGGGETSGQRTILDPFHGGGPLGAAELRRLAKAVAGAEAELTPAHSEPLSDLEVLLRLQNNIKVRRRQNGEEAGALAAVESMLLLAPEDWTLWAEAAELSLALQARDGAAVALAQVVALAPDPRRREEAQKLLRQLSGRLN